VLNGALAGLVSITAEPLTPGLGSATLIGAVGGVIVVLTIPLLDKLKIDDVVGAIPVHGFAGLWGTLAVPLTNPDASFGTQIVGMALICGFMFVASLVVFLILKAVMGVRVSDEDQVTGLDKTEMGMEAYPEFSKT
ncbi:MAG: ammonium transporter, partial [Rhodobacteraceae bacterium]|nr:ammonium transporter [Paracoccaceae bacterium]